jgi:hypothetical protein
MKWQNTRFGLASLVLALCVWVSIPASSALANDEFGPGAGEFYTGAGQTGERGPEDVGGGLSGGLEADPDTFQIDSRVGGSIGQTQNPVPRVPGTDRFLFWVHTWLMVVFSGGFLRNWMR